ncbi:DUF4870 domain-containing protein [Agrobacterium tumefaciens]|nr:DUF4870 domain-containing protein [Agrobacterium tumefaciens]NTE21530.1 DUF4870 domain-containing protein [Agrobacterium tumefaciens]
METNTKFNSTDNGKSAAIVSYIFLIGWLISFFAIYKDNRTSLSTYHLRQSLLLHLSFIVINILFSFIVMIVPSLFIVYVSYAINIIYIVFIIMGAISASNLENKPLPVIGDKAQTLFPTL